jgi:hypothetical protein
VRLLYGQSVLRLIRGCESLEELSALGEQVRRAGVVASSGTERKWQRAVSARERELRARRIVVPRGAGRLIVPGR